MFDKKGDILQHRIYQYTKLFGYDVTEMDATWGQSEQY